MHVSQRVEVGIEMFVVSEASFVSILLRGLWLGFLPEDGKMGNRCNGSISAGEM